MRADPGIKEDYRLRPRACQIASHALRLPHLDDPAVAGYARHALSGGLPRRRRTSEISFACLPFRVRRDRT